LVAASSVFRRRQVASACAFSCAFDNGPLCAFDPPAGAVADVTAVDVPDAELYAADEPLDALPHPAVARAPIANASAVEGRSRMKARMRRHYRGVPSTSQRNRGQCLCLIEPAVGGGDRSSSAAVGARSGVSTLPG
jgi:hypothetical protein